MLRETRKIRLTLGSVNFSKEKRVVAALFLAATLLFISFPLYGAVRIEGMPKWMAESAEKSLNAVWNEMDRTIPLAERFSMLVLVGNRLLSGYTIETPHYSDGDVIVRALAEDFPQWRIELNNPSLPFPANTWFKDDTRQFPDLVHICLENVPVSALAWADMALRREIEAITKEHVPGWDISILVELAEGANSPVLRISFVPEQPLVLAVTPSVQSGSLPVAFQTDLKDNLQSGLFPVIGLPVNWVDYHKRDIEILAEQSLADRNIIENSKAKVDVSFRPSQISRADARVESSRYTIQAWAAAYGGTDDRYPELGLHVGRKALPMSGWNVELYGEWILSTNDFDLESRWGARWKIHSRILLGAEVAYPGEELWWRFWFTGHVKQPYVWWRYSENSKSNMGIGYRINEFLSIELHYDECDDDQWSIRAVGNL